MFGRVLNTLLLCILYYFRKTLHLRCRTGLLVSLFEMYKGLAKIILRERKKVAGTLWSI